MIDVHGEPVREFYRNQGAVAERERILNLLRQTISYPEQFDYETEIVKIIAAIEGESNGNV